LRRAPLHPDTCTFDLDPANTPVSQVVGFYRRKECHIHIRPRIRIGETKITLAKASELADFFSPLLGVTKRVIRAYIKEPQSEDHRLEELSLGGVGAAI